jgi:prepilin-type N-terminal cleavage/methylation domain-containing protein
LRTSAFTLIELLVSIAVIAALGVMLSPVIEGMVERGRSARCAGNLRQIGVAVQQFIADNNYRFPAIETVPPSLPPEVASDGTALEALAPYGITEATLTCPTDAATTRNIDNHGSSYHFSPVLQDETPVSVKIYSPRGIFEVENSGRLTVATDYQPVHRALGGIGFNVLKADGRVIKR